MKRQLSVLALGLLAAACTGQGYDAPEDAVLRQLGMQTRSIEMRRMRPPLNELLESKERDVALRGTAAERDALFASLDADKLQKVAAMLPPDALADRPDLRRMATMSRQPQQVVAQGGIVACYGERRRGLGLGDLHHPGGGIPVVQD